jgi:hypothetical protein
VSERGRCKLAAPLHLGKGTKGQAFRSPAAFRDYVNSHSCLMHGSARSVTSIPRVFWFVITMGEVWRGEERQKQ